METKVTGCSLASMLDVKAEVAGVGQVIRNGNVVYDTPSEAVEAKAEDKEATCDSSIE